jgi:hypothetical protein
VSQKERELERYRVCSGGDKIREVPLVFYQEGAASISEGICMHMMAGCSSCRCFMGVDYILVPRQVDTFFFFDSCK